MILIEDNPHGHDMATETSKGSANSQSVSENGLENL